MSAGRDRPGGEPERRVLVCRGRGRIHQYMPDPGLRGANVDEGPAIASSGCSIEGAPRGPAFIPQIERGRRSCVSRVQHGDEPVDALGHFEPEPRTDRNRCKDSSGGCSDGFRSVEHALGELCSGGEIGLRAGSFEALPSMQVCACAGSAGVGDTSGDPVSFGDQTFRVVSVQAVSCRGARKSLLASAERTDPPSKVASHFVGQNKLAASRLTVLNILDTKFVGASSMPIHSS